MIYGTGALRRGANEVVRVSINIFQRPLAGLMRIVLSKPALSERLNRILLRYPLCISNSLVSLSEVG